MNERKVRDVMTEGKGNYRMFVDELSTPFACCRVIKDSRGKTVDLIFLEVNPAFVSMTGFTQSEIIGKSFIPLIHHDDLGKNLEAGGDFNKLPHRAQVEQRVLTVNGWRWFQWENIAIGSADGNTVELYCLGRDITELKEVRQSIAIYKQAEDELQSACRRLDEIIDFLPDATFVIDNNGIVVAWNKAIEELTGVSREDMLGKGNYEYTLTVYEERRPVLIDLVLMPEDEFAKHKKRYESIERKGDKLFGRIYAPGAYNGKGAYLWTIAAKLYDAGGNIAGAIETIRDITERKYYEERLKHLSLHDQLTGLYNRAYFESELNRLNKSREYPITILFADIDNLKLINDSMGHNTGDKLLKYCTAVLRRSLRGSDILARIGGDEFAVILPRTGKKAGEEIVSRIYSQLEHYNQKKRKNQPFLSISLGLATAEDADENLLETVKEADDLMYRDKLHRGASAGYQMIASLLATLGERDFVTEGHARRLEELCLKIGKKIDLSRKQLLNLSLLAQVHDIGKVGIPDRILFREGHLDESERKIMQQHCEKGYRIAVSTANLPEIAELILKHHEHWDGSGYPLGIKGEEIPIECRILAIVDAYDAMTSDRPYRKATSSKIAVEELKKYSGTQFNPELVEIFLSIISDTKISGHKISGHNENF